MSRRTRAESGSQETVDNTADTPQVETPEVEVQETAENREESGAETPDSCILTPDSFSCPECQGTTGIKLGLPFEQDEQTFQYVKCTECSHVATQELEVRS